MALIDMGLTDQKISVQPVILCGGSGTRLWPLSRAGFPKQFLCLTGADSLFQQAAKRLGGAPYIVSNEEHRFLAQEQLRESGIHGATFLLEPVGRNTAPALTLAALKATENGADPVLVVIPSDQMIIDETAFQVGIAKGVEIANEGSVVILGVKPSKAATGYGYIQVPSVQNADALVQVVQRFVEKPDAATAKRYLEEGGYYWNAGIFVLKASVWLKSLQTFRPDIAQACVESWSRKSQDGQFWRPDKALFQLVPSESVDYAVMEKCPGSAQSIYMVPLNAGWSDLGAWDSVWSVDKKDTQGNSHHGDVISHKSQNTLVHANNRLVALVGVENMVVIDTSDAVLICDKSSSQEVKYIVDYLLEKQRDEQKIHRKVYRPWGWYDSIDKGKNFKVKRINVNPEESLSLQKHFHRAEHWIVVTGTAEITNGSEIFTLKENQSTYIPVGQVHRLRNPGPDPLEIIEIQTGSNLDEEDIVR